MAALVLVAHGVVHDVADQLLQQRHVARNQQRLGRHAVLQHHAVRGRHGAVASHDALDQRDQVHGSQVEVDVTRFELGERAEVVKQRRHVLRLAHRAIQDRGIGRLVLERVPPERAEMPLQDTERHHDVVRGVRDEIAQRGLAGGELLDVGAVGGRSLVEGLGHVGDLVVSGSRDGLEEATVRRLRHAAREAPQPHDERACGEPHDGQQAQRQHADRTQEERAGERLVGERPLHQHHVAGGALPRHAQRDLAPIPLGVPVRAAGELFAAVQCVGQLGRERWRERVARDERGVVGPEARCTLIG